MRPAPDKVPSSGLDPRKLAELSILRRAEVYDAHGLDRMQRVAAEEAARAVIAKRMGLGK